MGQNLGQRKTQTVTHTPIGHNGAGSTGRLSMGTRPLSSVRNATLCWRCRMPDQDLAPLREFFMWQTEKTWAKQVARVEK